MTYNLNPEQLNAPIHRKTAIRELVEETDHQVLFLSKYSPYQNDIEQDFRALKRARMYAPPCTFLDELICAYCAQECLFFI